VAVSVRVSSVSAAAAAAVVCARMGVTVPGICIPVRGAWVHGLWSRRSGRRSVTLGDLGFRINILVSGYRA
jgi:hypothetical protein